jgi:hypothetical protein
MNFTKKQKWRSTMNNNVTFEELNNVTFDMEGKDYTHLAESLEHWASMFFEEAISDEYSEQLTYLLFNMAKEMRNLTE